jgi:hypothetical protein
MQLVSVPTEQTTAATDAALALLGFGCAVWLWRTRRADPWRGNVWALAVGLVGLAAALGAFVHGFEISPAIWRLVWQPLNLALGLVVALFIVGVVGDLWGEPAARRRLPVMIAVGLTFYLLTLLVPGLFLLFALFELAAMVFAAAGYGWLTFRDRRKDFALMAAGISLSVLAALLQTRHDLTITIIWPFDHNGVFHLIQIPGLLALAAGVRRGNQGGK